ncbi:MAG: hypothetical protein ACTHMB_19560 [Candidatus Binatia bacterium]
MSEVVVSRPGGLRALGKAHLFRRYAFYTVLRGSRRTHPDGETREEKQ